MSRIGKKPVAIPSGVTAQIENGTLSVKGPKGTLVDGPVGAGRVQARRRRDLDRAGQRQQGCAQPLGLQRTLVSNLVEGVTEGFAKTLEITGVGYRAQAQGRKLKLQLGYSHDVELDVPEGLEVKTPDQTTIEISGIDKQAVGQFAAEIRRWRKPEPYKGKGIKYRGEYVFRKEGKKK
jgi:large subunit ribosomal protein L6